MKSGILLPVLGIALKTRKTGIILEEVIRILMEQLKGLGVFSTENENFQKLTSNI